MVQQENIEILDTTTDFFKEWEGTDSLTVDHLESYYSHYPKLFDEYFKSHCQRTRERLHAAIERYPSQFKSMKRAAKILPAIIQEVYEKMSDLMGVKIEVKTRLLVGGFGSNAYVTHDGTLHFAVEQLTDEPQYLRVLVAHELTHAYHFEMLGKAGFDFSKMAWDGFTSLYLEGAATFVSEVLNPGLSEHVYFSFDDTSEDWLIFFKDNYSEILKSLRVDLKDWDLEDEREWFRLRGGKKYGYNRLGYLVGKENI